MRLFYFLRRHLLATVLTSVVISTLLLRAILITDHKNPATEADEKGDAIGDTESFLVDDANAALSNDSDISQVIIVSYQRSGSSFLGEIFNQNHNAMQWFEPLDGVYSALYGTQHGFNVPSDIWNFKNGTARSLPMYELRSMANATSSILSCQFEQLPTEVLLHNFVPMFLQQQRRLAPYAQCIQQDGETTLAQCNKCNRDLSAVCSKRFDADNPTLQMCANELSLRRDPGALPPFPQVSSTQQVKKVVQTYQACMQPCRRKALSCVPILTNSCRGSNIRSIKPVRLTMSAARLVQESIPSVKIIHNIRDPRGVVNSRKHVSESFQSAFAIQRIKAPLKRKKIKYDTTVDIAKEAMLLCRNAASDVNTRRQMQTEHPNCVKTVLYEDYASRPIVITQEVYDFIGQPLPVDVVRWLTDNTSGKKVNLGAQTSRQANATMLKWQKDLSVHDLIAVNSQCRDFFQLTDHPWQLS